MSERNYIHKNFKCINFCRRFSSSFAFIDSTNGWKRIYLKKHRKLFDTVLFVFYFSKCLRDASGVFIFYSGRYASHKAYNNITMSIK